MNTFNAGAGSILDAKGAKDARKTPNEQPKFEDDFSGAIIGAAVEVQRVLGPGMLESAYCAALALELEDRGLQFAREVPIETTYKGMPLGVAFRADFIVQGSVIIEVKAQAGLTEAHRTQLISYLRTAGLPLGLLMNFHDFPLVKTVKRVANTYRTPE